MKIDRKKMIEYMLKNWVLYSSQSVKEHRLEMSYMPFPTIMYKVELGGLEVYIGPSLDDAIEAHNRTLDGDLGPDVIIERNM